MGGQGGDVGAGSVTVLRRGRVAVVTIDRPAVRNAVDRPTAAALVAAFTEFDAADDLDVAVLTGAGGTFCSGADLTAVSEGRGNRVDADIAADGPMGPTRLVLAKPVIAAIEGHAVAGGLELALWCDLRVTAADASLGVFCRRWGVPLVDGGTVRLPRLVGHGRAMDLILTGREVGAEEARAIGLVDRVCEPGGALAAAVTLAEELSALPQRCLRNDRRSALEQWGLDERAALANEVRLGLEVIDSGETLEGAIRFAAGAGRHGEGAWQAGPMGERSPIESISAVTLATADMERSLRFYLPLGFAVVHGGDGTEFTSLRAGAGFLNLQLVTGWVPPEVVWGRVILWVDDVDAMHDRLVGLGAEPDSPPSDAPWGERYFHVRDPDGHELSFAKLLPPT